MEHPNSYDKRKTKKNLVTTRPDREFLYFAYGSNLNIEQMGFRCGDAEPVRTLALRDWRLVFRGVADIEPSKGDTVQGALWRVSAADEAALDIYEGIEHGLYRKVLFTLNDSDEHCFMYLMNSKRVGVPTERYFQTIEQGFADWELDTTTLYDALLRSLPGDRATAQELLTLAEEGAAKKPFPRGTNQPSNA
jgi:gamma-glutamylcyclotransferase (GGCT)/AIG2-like uncharacterized protein YtfP